MDEVTLKLLSDPTVTHGKRYTYTKKRCRCDKCKEANAEYKLTKTTYHRSIQASPDRQSLSPDAQAILDKVTHGTLSAYEWYGCRCEKCKETKRRMNDNYRVIRFLKVA